MSLSRSICNMEALTKTRVENTILTTIILGCFGLIPFLASSALILSDFIRFGHVANSNVFGIYTPLIFVSYSAIILSFLCGTLWGSRDQMRLLKQETTLLLFTNLIAVIAWFLILAVQISNTLLVMGVFLLGVSFVVLFFVEITFTLMNHKYKVLRFLLTAAVFLSHMIVLFCLVGS